MTNNIQYYILIGGGLVIIIFFLIFAGLLPGKNSSAPVGVTLEFWGVEDDNAIWRDIIEDLKKKYPHIAVNYQRFDGESYEETLINRLAEGKGPDVFFLKNSWVIKHRDKILPLPQQIFGYTTRDFRREFADVASEDLITKEGQILGLPLSIDTLALFYNKDIFNTEGVASLPQTWDELQEIVKKVTRKDAEGRVTRGGLALGGARNIEHFFEILSALILQNGDLIIDGATPNVNLEERSKEAVGFYLSFANPLSQNFSGNLGSKNSLDALADGSVAMAVGFSQDIRRLRAKNPHLNLGIAPLPQVKDATDKNYGNYYFPAVSRFSRNPEAAWQFMFYIASRDASGKYLEKTNRPAARRDLVASGAPADELDVFYRQSLTAQSWPIPDENSAKRIFRDMLESAGSRSSSVEQAVNRAREQLRLLLP